MEDEGGVPSQAILVPVCHPAKYSCVGAPLASVGLDLLALCRGKYGRVADVGTADGDLAFFLEELVLVRRCD